MRIRRTPLFERQLKKLVSEAEMRAIEDEIAFDPEAWPVIRGTSGCRKARGARGSSGKSGGVRVIYYLWDEAGTLIFLLIYAKSRQEDISDADKKMCRQAVQVILENADGEDKD